MLLLTTQVDQPPVAALAVLEDRDAISSTSPVEPIQPAAVVDPMATTQPPPPGATITQPAAVVAPIVTTQPPPPPGHRPTTIAAPPQQLNPNEGALLNENGATQTILEPPIGAGMALPAPLHCPSANPAPIQH